MKKTNIRDNSTARRNTVRRFYFAICFALMLCVALSATALADGEAGDNPLSIVNNLSDFVFSAIRAIGVIVLGWGVVQVGMSIQSHDASQRTQGFLCLFGGLLIAFAKELLGVIGVL